jgi:hypothetical protein
MTGEALEIGAGNHAQVSLRRHAGGLAASSMKETVADDLYTNGLAKQESAHASLMLPRARFVQCQLV